MERNGGELHRTCSLNKSVNLYSFHITPLEHLIDKVCTVISFTIPHTLVAYCYFCFNTTIEVYRKQIYYLFKYCFGTQLFFIYISYVLSCIYGIAFSSYADFTKGKKKKSDFKRTFPLTTLSNTHDKLFLSKYIPNLCKTRILCPLSIYPYKFQTHQSVSRRYILMVRY